MELTELYGVQQQMRCEKAYKSKLITLGVIWGVVIVACIVSCVVVDRELYTPNLVVNIVLCVIAGWITLFMLDNQIIPLKRELSIGEDAFSARKHTITGPVIEYADHPEIVHAIRCYKLCIKPDDGSEDWWCHISEARFDGSFGKGDRVTVTCYGNLVVAYEKEGA